MTHKRRCTCACKSKVFTNIRNQRNPLKSDRCTINEHLIDNVEHKDESRIGGDGREEAEGQNSLSAQHDGDCSTMRAVLRRMHGACENFELSQRDSSQMH